ncbi:MAG: hypothetical protein ACI9DJ_001880 [Algoriphagus sp.]|jgi:hypothetical protein
MTIRLNIFHQAPSVFSTLLSSFSHANSTLQSREIEGTFMVENMYNQTCVLESSLG